MMSDSEKKEVFFLFLFFIPLLQKSATMSGEQLLTQLQPN